MMKGSFFAGSKLFGYLPEQDRYLSAAPRPEHHFNVIGSGMMGLQHINVTMLEGSADINGIYDQNRSVSEKAKAFFEATYPGRTLRIYDTLEEACTDPTVDGLIVSTPNYTHIDVIRKIIHSGKNILLEKPMATRVEDAAEIAQLAESYDAVLQIGLQYRYKPIYTEAIRRSLSAKDLGDIRLVNLVEHRIPFLDKVGQWNKFNRFSGGTLVEKCCHYFDLLDLFAGARPKTVYAVGGQAENFTEFEYHGEKSDIMDHANVSIVFENGVKANFNLCMFAPQSYEELVVCGSRGRLKAVENHTFLEDGQPETKLEVFLGDEGTSFVGSPVYPKGIQSSGHLGATYFEHRDFVNRIEGRTHRLASEQEGLWAIIAASAAQQSIAEGRIVEIGEFLEQYPLARKVAK